MAVLEVFSQPELRRYKSHLCSLATFVQLFCILLTFIPPLLIAYRSQGFWQKTAFYKEQAEIKFKHEVVIILELQNGNYITWSTYQNFNALNMDNLRIPLLKSREVDENGDGKYDRLDFTLQMPLLDTEQVVALQLILIFDYRLYKFSTFHMECMGYIYHSFPNAGATFQTIGDLRMQQREPLSHRGYDDRFIGSVIDSSSIYAEAYDLASIFKQYSERNISTAFTNSYPVWITGRGVDKPFIVKTTVRYPEETIEYFPGFWQLIKGAWIQYAAILLVFLFVFDRIKIFIFQNQLVTTIIERPFPKYKKQ